MTLSSNHLMSCSIASLLTAVGFSRVSIGPPIRVAVAGTQLSPQVDITEMPARRGTLGWHTAIVWVLGPR